MKTYWGDIHNHCAVSYGNGTPKQALDNARQHLDFCSITGHAFWPDMPTDIKWAGLLTTHFGGFQKLQFFWKSLMAEIKAANKPGKFVVFPSYEWHSMKYGDYNVYFNMDDAPLIDAPTLAELVKKTAKFDAMIFPHHCSYLPGFRGTRWRDFDASASPLVEIFSNHGCGESDDSYYDYYHVMGPRIKDTSVREGLLKGHKFGFCASTDTHDGYPGHYGHGRLGVIADKLDRENLWEAMRKRRTIASTGARIEGEVYLDDAFIGDTVKNTGAMNMDIKLSGTSPIETVEIIEGFNRNCKIHRLPMAPVSTEFTPGRYKIKIECGWGRRDTVQDWDLRINLKNGKLLGAIPYYRFSSCDINKEISSEKLSVSKNRVHWQCRTKQNPATLIGGTHFAAGGTQLLILEVDAVRNSELELEGNNISIKIPLNKLIKGSTGKAISGYCSPALKVHRAIPEREYSFSYEGEFTPAGKKGFIYVRTRQVDGQVAWISPIWYE